MKDKDKHHDDKLIIISVVTAVIISKFGDGLLNNEQIFGWLGIVTNEIIRGILGLIIYVFILIALTFALLPLIKWFAKKFYQE